MSRLAFLLFVILLGTACASPSGEGLGPPPTVIPPSGVPQPSDLTKMGPELRRLLLERGRQVLGESRSRREALERISVTIRARRDITPELIARGVEVRSVTSDDVAIITADVPPAAIPALIALPDLETIELTQPVPPASEETHEP